MPQIATFVATGTPPYSDLLFQKAGFPLPECYRLSDTSETIRIHQHEALRVGIELGQHNPRLSSMLQNGYARIDKQVPRLSELWLQADVSQKGTRHHDCRILCAIRPV